MPITYEQRRRRRIALLPVLNQIHRQVDERGDRLAETVEQLERRTWPQRPHTVRTAHPQRTRLQLYVHRPEFLMLDKGKAVFRWSYGASAHGDLN